MNLSEQELAKKIVQYVANELNGLASLGDLKWNMTNEDRQIHYRIWATHIMNLLKISPDDNITYVGQFDGSAKPNPGIMKIGGHIKIKGTSETLYSFSIGLDEGTNNRAEYLALIELLEIAIRKGIKRMEIYGDSNLAVQQVNDKWKANKDMTPFRDRVKLLLGYFDYWSLAHVPRKLNSEADSLTR